MTTWDMTKDIAVTTSIVLAVWYVAVRLIERAERKRRNKRL